MKWTKCRFKLSVIAVVIFVCVFLLQYKLFGARKTNQSDKYIALLKQDLARAKIPKLQTENPVVLNFRKKNSEKSGGLKIVSNQPYSFSPNALYSVIENEFFRYLEDKDILCANDVRLGAQHDGGWNVCMSPPFKLTKPCLVYSFGIGEDWRFEDDINDFYGCTVMAYDPNIGRKEHNRTEQMHFKPYGLGTRADMITKDSTLKTFREHLKHEGHLKAVIDYLKFDIEYKEWDVVTSLISENILQNVKQIGFEMHLLQPPLTVDGDQGVSREDLVEKFVILKSLHEAGFRKFNYRLNPFCVYNSVVTGKSRSKCYELHFINMDFIETNHLEKGARLPSDVG